MHRACCALHHRVACDVAVVSSQAAIAYQYVDGEGCWRCLYDNATLPNATVRSLADFMYVGQAVGVMAGSAPSFLPANIRQQAVAFFMVRVPCACTAT